MVLTLLLVTMYWLEKLWSLGTVVGADRTADRLGAKHVGPATTCSQFNGLAPGAAVRSVKIAHALLNVTAHDRSDQRGRAVEPGNDMV